MQPGRAAQGVNLDLKLPTPQLRINQEHFPVAVWRLGKREQILLSFDADATRMISPEHILPYSCCYSHFKGRSAVIALVLPRACLANQMHPRISMLLLVARAPIGELERLMTFGDSDAVLLQSHERH
jgi:hypothetical protein